MQKQKAKTTENEMKPGMTTSAILPPRARHRNQATLWSSKVIEAGTLRGTSLEAVLKGPVGNYLGPKP